MKKILRVILFLTLFIPLSSLALDCQKKPCHRDCIANQPESIQTQCRCDARKKIYYHYWGTNFGVPEYEAVCDGSFEQYRVQYCSAKIRYDNQALSNPYSGNNYIPEYDPMCDTEESYYQKMNNLKQNQYYNKMIDALSRPVQVNVRGRVDSYNHY